MLPLPGFVRRAIFAEYEPEVEYLDAIAWRKSRRTLYVRHDATAATPSMRAKATALSGGEATLWQGEIGTARRPKSASRSDARSTPTCRSAYQPAESGYVQQSA